MLSVKYKHYMECCYVECRCANLTVFIMGIFCLVNGLVVYIYIYVCVCVCVCVCLCINLRHLLLYYIKSKGFNNNRNYVYTLTLIHVLYSCRLVTSAAPRWSTYPAVTSRKAATSVSKFYPVGETPTWTGWHPETCSST